MWEHIMAHVGLTEMVLPIIELIEQEESAGTQFLVNFMSQPKLQDTDITEMTSLL